MSSLVGPRLAARYISLQVTGDFWASQALLVVICLPMQETRETWVRFLGPEDPLEEEMATHSSIFARRVLGMGEPGRLQSMGSHRVGHD